MRLIDADALAEMLDVEYRRKMKLVQNGETHLDTLAEGIMSMSVVLGTMPTVEAVVLPCKLGDPVSIIGGKYRAGRFEQWINPGKFRLSDLEKMGKTVFLTREEAEAALAERKMNDA